MHDKESRGRGVCQRAAVFVWEPLFDTAFFGIRISDHEMRFRHEGLPLENLFDTHVHEMEQGKQACAHLVPVAQDNDFVFLQMKGVEGLRLGYVTDDRLLHVLLQLAYSLWVLVNERFHDIP